MLQSTLKALMMLGLWGLVVVHVRAESPSAEPPRAEPYRVLVYGDSNTWGYEPRADGELTLRYPRSKRWTGIIQSQLGLDYEILEDGMNLRTTDLDGDDWPGYIARPEAFNGAKHLPVSIAAHMPLDLVVIMLGTNDLQARYQRSPDDIAFAAIRLARQVQMAQTVVGNRYPAPKVLLVLPPQVADIPIKDWLIKYAGAKEKSAQFSSAYKQAALQAELPLFDAGIAIGGMVHGEDGIHLSEKDHDKLAKAIVPVIRTIIEDQPPTAK